jgi:hypothetical protein
MSDLTNPARPGNKEDAAQKCGVCGAPITRARFEGTSILVEVCAFGKGTIGLTADLFGGPLVATKITGASGYRQHRCSFSAQAFARKQNPNPAPGPNISYRSFGAQRRGREDDAPPSGKRRRR